MNEKDAMKAAEEAAIQEGIQAEVKITLEKKAGEDKFERHIEASSASSALNGLAILLTEYAALIGVNVLEVLSLLAVVLAGPRKGEKNEQSKK